MNTLPFNLWLADLASKPFDNPNEGRVSELQVLQSAAGFYVGTTYREDYGTVPNSRDSDYFATREEAQAFCDYLTIDD